MLLIFLGVSAAQGADQGDIVGESLRFEIGDGHALHQQYIFRRQHVEVARQSGVVAHAHHAIGVFAFGQRGAGMGQLVFQRAAVGIGVRHVAQRIGQRLVVERDRGVVFGAAGAIDAGVAAVIENRQMDRRTEAADLGRTLEQEFGVERAQPVKAGEIDIGIEVRIGGVDARGGGFRVAPRRDDVGAPGRSDRPPARRADRSSARDECLPGRWEAVVGAFAEQRGHCMARTRAIMAATASFWTLAASSRARAWLSAASFSSPLLKRFSTSSAVCWRTCTASSAVVWSAKSCISTA